MNDNHIIYIVGSQHFQERKKDKKRKKGRKKANPRLKIKSILFV